MGGVKWVARKQNLLPGSQATGVSTELRELEALAAFLEKSMEQ